MQQILVSVTVLILALPMLAQAQSDEAEAAAAFRSAVNAYDKKEYATAATLFRRANALNFNWKLLYNIGQSEAAARRNGLALQAFEEYLTRGGDDIPFDRREEVLGEIQRLKLIVGMLEVDAPKGSIVKVDGEERDSVPMIGPIMISAGIPHEVTIIFDGQQILQQSVRVSGGNTQKLTATSQDTVTAAKQGEAPTPPSESTKEEKGTVDAEPESVDNSVQYPPKEFSPTPGKEMVGPILVAAGGAVLGAGFVVGGLAYMRGSDLDEKYPNGLPDSKQNEIEKVDNMALAADILIPVGAATAIAGFVIWMVQKKKFRNEQALAPIPVVTRNTLSASVTGRF